MWKKLICMGTSNQFKMSLSEQIKSFKQIGFDAFFTGYTNHTDALECRRVADETGMIYQSIHAPFENSALMWKPYEAAKPAIEELLECLKACKENHVPIMVCHTYIGFDDSLPTEDGIQNFKIIVDAAQEMGVRIAFENTEGEVYLEKLMDAFADKEHVGFCWDSGHELCYNHGQDMLAKYGDRLFCTHLNDNLGIRDYEGKITWIDDLHLLPFDGIVDWEDVAERLHACDYKDILTFELNIGSKPGRHENDAYGRMELSEYFTECYKRACKVAALVMKKR